MSGKKYKIKYGETGLSFSLPEGFSGSTALKENKPPIENLRDSITEALRSPVNSPPLRELAAGKNQICIVVTDNTRPCPNHLLLPPLLDELIRRGIIRQQIKILIGGGLHRALNREEKIALLGEDICSSFEICDHDASDREQIRSLGFTDRGTPVTVNRLVREADLVISTGVVELHQYAGFSGGRKTVAIGAAGVETIKATHSYKFLRDENVCPGNLSDNIFHEELGLLADRMRLDFILNLLLNDNGRVAKVIAGDPRAAFFLSTKAGSPFYPTKREYDIVIGGVGAHKGANLYQASRGASYLYSNSCLKENGVIVLAARAEEGCGWGWVEKRFFQCLSSVENLAGYLNRCASEQSFGDGEHRAFIMARTLSAHPVIMVGTECPSLVSRLHMTPAENMEEAVLKAREKLKIKHPKVLVVPDALTTIPVFNRGN